jgi:hypothetical protein
MGVDVIVCRVELGHHIDNCVAIIVHFEVLEEVTFPRWEQIEVFLERAWLGWSGLGGQLWEVVVDSIVIVIVVRGNGK